MVKARSRSTQNFPSATPLDDELQELTASLHHSPRDEALILLRRHMVKLYKNVRQDFEAGHLTGVKAAKQLARQMDAFLVVLFTYCAHNRLITDKAPEKLIQQTVAIPGLAITAIGGYGRRMLAPFSDIDLLFLTENQPSTPIQKLVEDILYMLWDLGIKVGYSTRSIEECIIEAEQDTTVRTALLDTRLLYGDTPLFEKFETEYLTACSEAGVERFIKDKQEERTLRHKRFGDSPYLVEPNVKEGRGGLRDMQTLYWLCRYIFGANHIEDLLNTDLANAGLLTEQEAKRAQRSWDFLWTVRFHLHYIAGRAEERLTFDMQPVVGGRMGYTRHGRQVGVERFMRHYFLTAREAMRLTHILEPAIIRLSSGMSAQPKSLDPELDEKGFLLMDGKVLQKSGVSFDRKPIMMLRLLECAQQRNKEIHPMAMHEIIRWERRASELRGDAEAGRILLKLICGPKPDRRKKALPALVRTTSEDVTVFSASEAKKSSKPVLDNAYWLNILNETGLLGKLIPPWSSIVGQMQFDTYHVFTVDEHTIKALHILNQLESGKITEEIPLAYELVKDLQSRRALYVAVLLHDIAKGRKGDHSEIGSEIAYDVCPYLGLSAEETETVSWLVLHHLLLSHTAFQRDIDDPKTILDLVDTIQSPERLRLLLILTIVDMRAVNPNVWNAWKATLLKELYLRVAEILAGGMTTTERDVRVTQSKEAVAALLYESGMDEESISTFLDLGYGGYWLSFDQETHARHALMIIHAEQQKTALTIETLALPARGVTEVTIYTVDHPGLFSRITGALTLVGASIVDARIHTMSNGMALDTFWVQDAANDIFGEPQQLDRLRHLIEQSLSQEVDLNKEMARSGHGHVGRRMRAIHVPPRVVFDNRASNTYTVIEINGRDRPGLLYDVTEAISNEGIQIASAHITTYGIRAIDVFYVKDLFGLKITDEKKLERVRSHILQVLHEAENKIIQTDSPQDMPQAHLNPISTFREDATYPAQPIE